VWCEDASLTFRACALERHEQVAEFHRSPVTIRDCLIGWSYAGVIFSDGSDAIVDHCRAQWTGGAFTCNASSPSIVDNEIGGFGGQMCVGVNCNQDGSAYIARNTFRDVEYKTIQIGPADPIIEENLFINGSTAINIWSEDRVPIVRNNILYGHSSWIIEITSCNPVIENNTIDKGSSNAFVLELGANPVIRNNLVTRVGTGILCFDISSPVLECNNMWMVPYPYAENCPDQTGINGNISVDPEFCGIWDSMDYRLQSDSPCAPGNHPDGYECGQIGAKGVGCSITPTKKKSWGAVKALYRGEERK
jgi:hypothetical protein